MATVVIAMALALGQFGGAVPAVESRPRLPPSSGTYVITPPLSDLTAADPPPGGTRAQSINPASWVSAIDYPHAAVVGLMEGRTFYQVRVSSAGRPIACSITRSSGFVILDAQTCAVVLRRAMFNPARDADGAAVDGDYVGIMRWQIPYEG